MRLPSSGVGSHSAQRYERLKWALQALVQPSAVQLQLYPEFVCVPDELALDFDEALRCIDQPDLSREQWRGLAAVHALLESMSGPDKPFWTAEALSTMPEWRQVRALARECLLVFDWPLDAPPWGRAIYVFGAGKD